MSQTIVLATATSAEGEILQKQFTSAGFDVCLAESENAALDVLRQTPTDLLVIEDAVTLDGRGIIQAVRSEASLSTVPILIISRAPTSEEIIDYLSSGADDVISPFQPRVIVARVRAILRRQK
ncbi:MAG: response regulator transcription factor [Anaerolineales bacterium]|nr:response regulator transcription factor [Anaerolineales bacterium]